MLGPQSETGALLIGAIAGADESSVQEARGLEQRPSNRNQVALPRILSRPCFLSTIATLRPWLDDRRPWRRNPVG